MATAGVGAGDLDDEERKALAEVAAIGYYHGRPKHGTPSGPMRIDCAQSVDASTNFPMQLEVQHVISTNTSASGSPESDVAVVLNACDFYAVIGASHGAGASELRRHYIQASVRVHPRRNCCIGAQEAFQRTALAWLSLGNMGARWRYDMELQAGRGLLNSATPHVLPPMNEDQACESFASAVAQTSVGQSSGDFATVLTSAQELVQADQAAASLPTRESIARGLAFSAALLAVGVAANAVGHPVVASYAERGALYQGVSQVALGGVAAYQDAGVRDKFQSAFATICYQAERVASDVQRNTQRLSDELLTGETASSLRSLIPESCLYRIAHREESEPNPQIPDDEVSDIAASEDESANNDACKETVPLCEGIVVRITGLPPTCGLNGCIAETLSFTGGRYLVRILPDAMTSADSGNLRELQKLVKRENLQVVIDFPAQRLEGNQVAPKSEDDFI